MAGPGVTDVTSLDAREIARLVRTREASAVEIFEAFVARTESVNPMLDAIVRFDPSIGRREAQEADRRAARGDDAPLLGVPYTVKDTLWVEGRVCSQGSALYATFVAPCDADAVARMRAAGGVFLGTTNCSEFACKGVTTNRLYGPTRNPWDLERTPGGSSGGAAAAVAAGLGPIGIATDGGGSTRRPAAHVGAVGLKPSAGLIPHTRGFAEPVFGNSVIGVIARRIHDAADVLGALAAFDRGDPVSVPDAARIASAQVPSLRRGTVPGTAGDRPLRVGYSPRLGLGFAVDEDVQRCVAHAVDRLRDAGVQVEARDPRWPEGAAEQSLMPLQLAGLAALYGERYRHARWDVDPDIGAQIEAGLAVTGAQVAQALLLREALYRALERYFGEVDLLLTPTTAATAWPWSQPGPPRIEGRAATPRGHAVFTPLFNHTYVPACSVPVGLDAGGLPVGLQIVGPRLADARVLALAALVEAQCPYDFGRPRDPRRVA